MFCGDGVNDFAGTKKRRYQRHRRKMLNSGQALHAQKTVPEHTKRGVVAQVLFCESSQSVTTK